MKWLLAFLFCTLLQVGHAQTLAYWQEKQQSADNLFSSGQFNSALEMYRNVAEETASVYSQFRVAWIYEQGLGVERNCKEAARWYTLAANSGNEVAQNNLSVLYRNGCPDLPINTHLATQYLEMSAKAGNSRAQANLSMQYATGDSVSKNPYLAYDLAQRSAKQNDIYGIVLLARFYMDGIGVPPSDEKAYALLSSAATMEASEQDKITKQQAQYLMGEFLFEGKGVPKNLISAYQWFLLSGSGPDKEMSDAARKHVSDLDSVLSDLDRQQASNKASALGDRQTAATQDDLLVSLKQALTERKEQDAVRLARMLAEQESADGQMVLGSMYRDGYASIEQDLDESYILFKRACKSGNWEACGFQVDILAKMKRTDEAKMLLINIAQSAPNSDEMQLFLGQLNFILGDTAKSEQIAR